ELAFSDRPVGLVIGHAAAGDFGARRLTLQSNGPDCFLLGPEGCADLGVYPGTFPDWYPTARALQIDLEAAMLNVSRTQGGPAVELSELDKFRLEVEAPPAQEWASAGELSYGIEEGVSPFFSALAWFPSRRLMFRHPLPQGWSATKMIVTGRVTLEVAELSGSRLKDERLGPGGRVFLVDGEQNVLSSLEPKDLLTIDPGTNSIRLRKLRELPDSSWADQLQEAFDAKGKISEVQMRDQAGLTAVLSPLAPPLHDFAVVVVTTLAGSTFVDDTLFGTMLGLSGVTVLPYLASVIAGLALLFKTQKDAIKASKKKPNRPSIFKGLMARRPPKWGGGAKSPQAWDRNLPMGADLTGAGEAGWAPPTVSQNGFGPKRGFIASRLSGIRGRAGVVGLFRRFCLFSGNSKQDDVFFCTELFFQEQSRAERIHSRYR
ncbi:unnamed protein product, partial [Polarella glacialis]